MRPAVRRRIVWTFTIGLGLILLASGILVFAEATAISDEATRCAPSIWQSQWPRYLGCAMTTHEVLAGGLIVAAGALFAALLVIDAIQEPTSTKLDRQKLEQAEAKVQQLFTSLHWSMLPPNAYFPSTGRSMARPSWTSSSRSRRPS
jgi:hypothetical protein